jgi:hypothetical protein
MWSSFKNHGRKPSLNVENRGSDFETARSPILDNWSKKMETFSSRLSKKSLVCALALFVMLTASACFYCISESLANNAVVGIKISPISKPSNQFGKSFDTHPQDIFMVKKEIKRIIDFRIYLNRLTKTRKGKISYDSINRCRPGLLDSLALIENYYKHYFKN